MAAQQQVRVAGIQQCVVSVSVPYDLLLLAHAGAATVATASTLASGHFASEARRLARIELGTPDAHTPDNSETVALLERVGRFYSPGAIVLPRIAYMVPVLGVALFLSSGQTTWLSAAWLQGGIGLWILAIVLDEGVLWPAERRLKARLSMAHSEQAAERNKLWEEIESQAHWATWGSGLVSLAFSVSFILMIWHLK